MKIKFYLEDNGWMRTELLSNTKKTHFCTLYYSADLNKWPLVALQQTDATNLLKGTYTNIPQVYLLPLPSVEAYSAPTMLLFFPLLLIFSFSCKSHLSPSWWTEKKQAHISVRFSSTLRASVSLVCLLWLHLLFPVSVSESAWICILEF